MRRIKECRVQKTASIILQITIPQEAVALPVATLAPLPAHQNMAKIRLEARIGVFIPPLHPPLSRREAAQATKVSLLIQIMESQSRNRLALRNGEASAADRDPSA